MKSLGTGPYRLATFVDLYDELTEQLDRLRAIATLMRLTSDTLDVVTAAAVGWLLKDLHERMEAILDETRRRISAGS